MRFSIQFVYLLGTESLTGAAIALGVILIIGMIHKFCSGFSHRQEIGWLAMVSFLVPFWYIGNRIVHVWIPSYRYGAISDEVSIYGGAGAERIAAIILLIWAAGVLAGIVFLTVRQIRQHRTLAKAVRVTDPYILYKVEELQEELKICRNITVLYHPDLTSPGCAGIWKPYIVMNRDAMDRENADSVLCHELIHIKRNDMLFRYILDFISVIHWFNPFAHMLRLFLIKQIEYGCDVYAILHTGWTVCPGDYITSISQVIKKRDKNVSYVLPFGARQEDMEKRIKYLKKLKYPKRLGSLSLVVLACGIFFGTAFTAYAANRTVTGPYVDWLKTASGAAICEGEGEPIPVIDAEYTTREVIDAGEREYKLDGNNILVDWTLEGGETGISKPFDGSAVDGIQAMLIGEDGISYEAGLMQPDGEIIWIHLDGDGAHDFVLTQNGAHRLVVRNASDQSFETSITLIERNDEEK